MLMSHHQEQVKVRLVKLQNLNIFWMKQTMHIKKTNKYILLKIMPMFIVLKSSICFNLELQLKNTESTIKNKLKNFVEWTERV